MITPRFDELIHAPTRLSLVAFLAATGWADFAVLRDSVGLSDSALSKQLTTLADAGYIEIRKAFAGKRPRTSARLTAAGRTAFDRHVLALQEIVAGTAGRWPLPAGHPGIGEDGHGQGAPDAAIRLSRRSPCRMLAAGSDYQARHPADPARS